MFTKCCYLTVQGSFRKKNMFLDHAKYVCVYVCVCLCVCVYVCPDSTRTSRGRLCDVCVCIWETYFLGRLLIWNTSHRRPFPTFQRHPVDVLQTFNIRMLRLLDI